MGIILKKTGVGISFLMLIFSLSLMLDVQPAKASGTVYIRADGSIDPPTAPIQRNGDVYTLTGNLTSDADGMVVEKNSTVIDGAGYTFQGTGRGSGISLYERSNVTVKNTNIAEFYYGICLNLTDHDVVHGSTIRNNYYGVYLYESSSNVISGNDLMENELGGGLWIEYGSNNSIFDNNLTSNTNGGISLSFCSNSSISDNSVGNNFGGVALELSESFGNTINGNDIVANDGYGIGLFNSPNNTLRTNTMSSNSPNFGVDGESLSDFVNDVDDSNTVDGKPIYYWVNKQDLVVQLNAGYVALVNCTRIAIRNLSLTIDNLYGVLLAYTTNSIITKNTISNSFFGVRLLRSPNNTISGNNITNTYYGTWLNSSSNNSIVGNNITNNNINGIVIEYCSNNTISGNNITNNSDYGVRLESSSYNRICGNTFVNDGLAIFDSFENTVEDNTVNGKSLVYLEGAANEIVADAGQIILVNCQSIKVQNIRLANTDVGVFLWNTRNSEISNNLIGNDILGIGLSSESNNNTISGNFIMANRWQGVNLYGSSNNNIFGNNIAHNSYSGIGIYDSLSNTVSGNNIFENRNHAVDLINSSYSSIARNNIANNSFGISLESSSNNSIIGDNIASNRYGIYLSGFLAQPSNNLIYHNNFTNNTKQVDMFFPFSFGEHPPNVWDNGYPFGGNYWSDYSGTDLNQDGIGDSSYAIGDGNEDRYPLMNALDTIFHVHNLGSGLGYSTIQLGIGAPETENGNIIAVDEGTYYEHVVLNKSVTLVGENWDNTIIDGSGTGDVVVVTADNVTIENFKIRNSGSYYAPADCGISVDEARYCNIIHNSMVDNSVGVELHMSTLMEPSYNTVSSNIITGKYDGISISGSSNNNITGNNIAGHIYLGIGFQFTYGNLISGNELGNNGRGISGADSVNAVMTENNIVHSLNEGMFLLDCSHCNISRNEVANNDGTGIYLYISSENLVYQNNFVNNTDQSQITNSVNVWDNGCEGNYWSDCNHTDTDGDGICDTQYALDANNTDRYPLVNVYWSLCDINHDLKVDMKDIGKSAKAFATIPGDVLWNPHADITGPEPLVSDGKVDMRDIGLVARHFGEHYA